MRNNSLYILPVAGCIPEHVAVLPGETGAPRDHILDLDEIQTESQTAGVALIINANDRFNRSGRLIAWLRIVCYAHP